MHLSSFPWRILQNNVKKQIWSLDDSAGYKSRYFILHFNSKPFIESSYRIPWLLSCCQGSLQPSVWSVLKIIVVRQNVIIILSLQIKATLRLQRKRNRCRPCTQSPLSSCWSRSPRQCLRFISSAFNRRDLHCENSQHMWTFLWNWTWRRFALGTAWWVQQYLLFQV